MILTSPIPFSEALMSRDVKRIMPTNLSSADLARLAVAIRERSTFSAKTLSAHYLEAIAQKVREILNPRTEFRDDETPFTAGLDQATARLELKKVLQEIGYQPDPEKAGTIEDLSSDRRIDLVIETNVEMAQGYGQWRQGQEAELLDVFPAQELFRAEAREQERPWHTIWLEAARKVGDTGAVIAYGRSHRMVARKDSAIWVEISDFGQPYPPFKFNSGMDVMDVDRDEAIQLGVIDDKAIVEPQRRSFEMEAA